MVNLQSTLTDWLSFKTNGGRSRRLFKVLTLHVATAARRATRREG
jgi:hypothetical protein